MLDPETQQCLDLMDAVIYRELRARIDVGDDPSNDDGCTMLSSFLAKMVLNSFTLQPVLEIEEECADYLTEVIYSEMRARVAFGDDPATHEGCETLSSMVIDMIFECFTVRLKIAK
ncbi:MAG: hypothetical protein AAF889_10780 [Cyanobacteria bacterium P01_D01_bin.73]